MLRAIREDEDAARALGKNTLLYKLQSLAISACLGAIAGFFLALNLATIHPIDFEPLVTFFAFSVLILGGLANYKGVAVGAVLFWFVLEATRFIELPDPPFTETRIAALRLAITGLLLIGLMAFRPQDLESEEMVIGEWIKEAVLGACGGRCSRSRRWSSASAAFRAVDGATMKVREGR